MRSDPTCSCGESFRAAGDVASVNNIPAATWALLSHQAETGHPPVAPAPTSRELEPA